MKRTTLAMLSCLLCACGASGLEFNGGSGETSFLVPRSEAIPHFPLPGELFDPVEQKWSFFVDVDGDNDVFDEDVFTNGRAAGQQALETGNLPSNAPNFSIPVTAPIPLTYNGIFRIRPNTDAWALDGDWINYDPPSATDETQIWGNAVQFRAGALSFVCQWFLLTVDGCPRFQEVSGYAGAVNGGIPPGLGDCSYTTILAGTPPSTPETLTYEDVNFQSMPISFTSSAGAPPPFALWTFTGAATNKTYPVDTTAITTADFPSSQQNRVDARIKFIDDKTGEAGEVLTTNVQADRWSVATPFNAASDPDLNTIHFEWVSNPLGVFAPPPLKYGGWREVPGENFFIESDYSPGPATLSEVPASNFFFASGAGNIPGGLYIDRVSPGDGTLAVYLPSTNTEAIAAQTYYIGAVLAHIVGLGVGFQESTFAAPGVSDGEEDLMNVNIETDLVFFMAAGRRLQFPSTTLLLAQNVVDFPHGSQARTDAQTIGDNDPLDPSSLYMKETLPGPMRQ